MSDDDRSPPGSVVAAAVAGDADAIGVLLARLRPEITRYCRSRIDPQTLPDVVQEICLGLLIALPRYENRQESFMPYVYRICRNKLVDQYRKSGRNKSVPTAVVPDQADHAAPAPDEAAMTRLDPALRALTVLSPDYRQILSLRLIHDLTAEQTARIIGGKSAAAIRLAQHRALTKVRQALNDPIFSVRNGPSVAD